MEMSIVTPLSSHLSSIELSPATIMGDKAGTWHKHRKDHFKLCLGLVSSKYVHLQHFKHMPTHSSWCSYLTFIFKTPILLL